MPKTLTEPQFWILAILEEGPRHGYQIIKRAAKLSDNAVRLATGTLYPALENLVSKGWIEPTDRVDPEAPNRRYYQLRESGHKALAEAIEAHKRALKAVGTSRARPQADG